MSIIDSNYLDVKLKVFKKDDNKEFRQVQNLTERKENFNQFMQLRNQLVIAAENFAGDKNFFPVLIPSLSKKMEEHLKPDHKMVDVVD